jgi:hypothetical protein
MAVRNEPLLILIYLLTAIWLTPGVGSTVHSYTETIHRTTQLTTLVGKLSGIRTRSGQTKINDDQTKIKIILRHVEWLNTEQQHS